MGKRLFLAFLVFVASSVFGILFFIQSSVFSDVIRTAIQKTGFLSRLGVDAKFSHLRIQFFPPALSMVEPEIQFKSGEFKVDRLDLVFYPLQLLSGEMRASEVKLVGGELSLNIDPSKKDAKPKKSGKFNIPHWEELLAIRADRLKIENTKLSLHLASPEIKAAFLAKSLDIKQEVTRQGPRYTLAIEINTAQIQEWDAFHDLTRIIGDLKLKAVIDSSGIVLDQLSLVSRESELGLSGKVAGNILSQGALLLDFQWKLKGEVSNWKDFFSESVEKVNGSINASGKVQGSLRGAPSLWKSTFSVNAKKGGFDLFQFSEFAAIGKWQLKPNEKFGEFNVDEITLTGDEIQRGMDGKTLASGGKIRVGSFDLMPEKISEIKVPVSLEAVHLHWLAWSVAKPVFPLDFRTTGNVNLEFTPASHTKDDWKLKAKLDLKIPRFQFDNQSLGKVKPRKKIIDTKELELTGEALISPKGFFPQNVKCKVDHSEISLSGDITSQKGFNLVASTDSISLSSAIGEIVEIPIAGEGKVSTRIVTEDDAVKIIFDTELKNAAYLNLNLGDLAGKITLNDQTMQLSFDGMQAKQQSVVYQGGGAIDLNKNTLALDFKILKGDMRDLNQIFSHLTKSLSWYPKTLTGSVKGSISLHGGLDLDQLVIDADATGNDWVYYHEKLRSIELKASYNKGLYSIKNFKGIRNRGQVNAQVSYHEKRGIGWKLSTQGLDLTDFDFISRLGLPLRGQIRVTSSGAQFGKNIESKSEIQISDVTSRGTPWSGSKLEIETHDGVAKLIGNGFENQVVLDWKQAIDEKSSSDFSMKLNAFNFVPILLVLNPKLIDEVDLKAQLTGLVRLRFDPGRFDQASGKIEISEYVISKGGQTYQFDRPISIPIDSGNFEFSKLNFNGPDGSLRFSLKSNRGKISGLVAGSVSLSLFELITPIVTQASGVASLNLDLSGELSKPVLKGSVTLKEADVLLSILESPFEELSGKILISDGKMSFDSLQANVANGKVNASGEIVYFDPKKESYYPTLRVNIQLDHPRLKIPPFQFIQANGSVRITGKEPPYLVSGDVLVDQALFKDSFGGSKEKSSINKVSLYAPSSKVSGESDSSLFELNLQARAEQGVWVRNEIMDAEWKGRVSLVNTIDSPRAVGKAEIIKGTVNFKDRTFQLQQGGVLEFDNPNVINPKFSISGNGEVGNYKIRAYTSGRPTEYKIELSSVPVLPENEILSLLSTGLTSDQMKKNQQTYGDRSIVNQTEAASLILNSMDFNRNVEKKTGFKIQVDQAQNTQQGASVFRPLGSSDLSASPKVIVRKEITQRIGVSMGTTVGVGSNSQREVNAELKMTPAASVIGVWNTFEQLNSNDLSTNSYGLDLKLQKRFK